MSCNDLQVHLYLIPDVTQCYSCFTFVSDSYFLKHKLAGNIVYMKLYTSDICDR